MESSRKILLTTVGIAILIIGLVGVTYAFFNYTRTGSTNIIRTGRIAFNSTQGTAITLNNLFPIDPSNTNEMNDATKVGTLVVNITGDTEYTGGIEYLVTAVNVQNSVGTKQLPISIDVSVGSNNGNNPVTTLGTASEDYFTDRGSTTSYYKVLSSDVISNNQKLLVGYIAPGATGVDGNIIIKAYIDKNEIAITDTYHESFASVFTKVITKNFSTSTCEATLSGVNNASTYCATASALQDAIDNSLTVPQVRLLINAGMVEEYEDLTSYSWVDGRVVLTTNEWNSLQTNGVSFQIRVEANEDTWVDEPEPEGTIPSCPGCYFMYQVGSGEYTYGSNGTTVETLTQDGESYSSNYHEIVDASHKNYFMGFTLNNGRIDKAYACGIKLENPNQGTPFCLQVPDDDPEIVANNISLITGPTLWNDPDGTAGRCEISSGETTCTGDISAYVSNNDVYVADFGEMMWSYAGSSDRWFYCGSVG